MPFLFVALSGYFMNAVASTVDKVLLSDGRIGSPSLYAFLNALSSIPFLVLLPFGFVLVVPTAVGYGVLSGLSLFFAILSMYLSMKENEVSRIAPLVGVAGLGFLFVLSLSVSLVSGNVVSLVDILALSSLAGGGFLLSRGRALLGRFTVPVILVSGALFGAALLLFRTASLSSNFVSALVWSKVGMLFGGMVLLAVPVSRKGILSGHDRFSGSGKRAAGTGGFFLLNQAFGGLGTILVSYAASLGSATFVQGLSGVQYGFVFAFATILSARFPETFRERNGLSDITTKSAAIFLLALGVLLSTMSGTLDRFL